MKSLLSLGALAFVVLSSTVSASAALQPNNQFAEDFFRIVNAKNENCFFSPISMRSAFAMVTEGANGETREQLDRVFHFANDDLAKSSLQKELRELGAAQQFQFSIANGVWIDKQFSILPKFRESLTTKFASELQAADFVHDSEAERLKINRWVELKTQLKIRDLFRKEA